MIYGDISNMLPHSWEGNGDDSDTFSNPDGSFNHNGSITMSLTNSAVQYLLSQRTNGILHAGDPKFIEEHKLWDYASEQSIHEVYPDAPDSLRQVYRLVVTSDLTINAMHERKEDVPIATAVLEIKQYSPWITPDTETSRELEAFCDSIYYADVTVKSYTQAAQWE